MATNPRKKEFFCIFFFSGKASRNLIEFMRMLSNRGECWKPDADRRSWGYLVKSCLTVSNVNVGNSCDYLVGMMVFGQRKRESRFSLFVDGMYGCFDSN